MARSKRANGSGSVYIKHGSFYGRWLTTEGGHANRRLGPVRRPGSRQGLTRAQAEKRLRELIETIHVTTDPERTEADAVLARRRALAVSRARAVDAHRAARSKMRWAAAASGALGIAVAASALFALTIK
jgi:hypothetical protein